MQEIDLATQTMFAELLQRSLDPRVNGGICGQKLRDANPSEYLLAAERLQIGPEALYWAPRHLARG